MNNAKLRLKAWKSDAAAWTPALGLMVLLSAGCGSVPKSYFYRLQVPSPPAAAVRTNYVLAVQEFTAPEELRDDRIIFYKSPTELNFYEQHRWAADPPTMLSELAERYLDQSGAFAHVAMMPMVGRADYLLRGRVFQFAELDYEPGGKVRVAAKFTLIRSSDQKIVWSGQRAVERAVTGSGMGGVVEAFNQACQDLITSTLPGAVGQVEKDSTQGQRQSH